MHIVNQECKDQFKSFVHGFRSIVPDKYLGIFSPLELQILMSGENVDIDFEDLRKHAKYDGGYFDQHPTIRHFWKVMIVDCFCVCILIY